MWKTLNGDVLGTDIVSEIQKIVDSELQMGHKIKICIGTDSQVKAGIVEFATVVVILRKGNGGRMLVKTKKEKNRMLLKERLLHEVTLSIETAYQLMGTIEKMGLELEVHADINTDPQFKSQSSFAEAKGYIMGMGFEFRAKPYAFASSCCANKVVN